MKNKIYLLIITLFVINSSIRVIASSSRKDSKRGNVQEFPLLTLMDAELLAFKSSLQLQIVNSNLLSVQEELKSIEASRFPKLTLTGSFQYIEKVPKVKIGLMEQSLSDHRQYSIGPNLTYNLWDGGIRKNLVESLDWKEKSAQINKVQEELEIKFNLRVKFVKAQLASLTHELVKDSLRVALDQAVDIKNKFQAGAISKIDLLSSQFELSNAEIREKQAQVEWQSSFQELRQIIGNSDIITSSKLEKWNQNLNIIRNQNLHQSEDKYLFSENPKVKYVEAKAKSIEELAESKSSGHWPQIQLSARTSIDYPFGSEKKQVNQNSIMATLQWDLYDFGGRSHESKKLSAEAKGLELQARLMQEELEYKYKITNEFFINLLDQLKSAENAENNSSKLTELKVNTYKLGKLSYLEVASSQVQHLESQIRKAKIEAQLLIQYFQLEYLKAKTENQINNSP